MSGYYRERLSANRLERVYAIAPPRVRQYLDAEIDHVLARAGNCALARMDAARLGFRDGVFDCVVCIQNGISAFRVDERSLMRESVRVTRPGGLALFSSYSDAFWEHRLEWFELQAEEGLVGAIDRERTRDGTIVCADGFTATTVGARRFAALAEELDMRARVGEIDSSSIFCEIVAGVPARKGSTP